MAQQFRAHQCEAYQDRAAQDAPVHPDAIRGRCCHFLHLLLYRGRFLVHKHRLVIGPRRISAPKMMNQKVPSAGIIQTELFPQKIQMFPVRRSAMAIYILFPSRQDLRPTEFPRDNFLTQCVRFLYAFDTNTGVCPSLHVAYSFGLASVWTKEKGVSRWWKAFVVVAVIFICLSTMFIKQHSAVDFFAALPVCLLAEFIVYGIPRLKPSPGGRWPSNARSDE